MDMFFVAVEIRDNPALANKPIAVGGMSMISTANYIARKFGVRSAMPGFIAMKLCPELILVDGSYSKYRAESKKVMPILCEYDPDYESMGIDEANLDITAYLDQKEINTEEGRKKIAEEMRTRVFETT